MFCCLIILDKPKCLEIDRVNYIILCVVGFFYMQYTINGGGEVGYKIIEKPASEQTALSLSLAFCIDISGHDGRTNPGQYVHVVSACVVFVYVACLCSTM